MDDMYGIPIKNYREVEASQAKKVSKKMAKFLKEQSEYPKVVSPKVFKFREMKYYDCRGSKEDGTYENFINSISGQVAHTKIYMGGNYGPGDEYEVITESGETFRMLYYGDGSASLTKIKN